MTKEGNSKKCAQRSLPSDISNLSVSAEYSCFYFTSRLVKCQWPVLTESWSLTRKNIALALQLRSSMHCLIDLIKTMPSKIKSRQYLQRREVITGRLTLTSISWKKKKMHLICMRLYRIRNKGNMKIYLWSYEYFLYRFESSFSIV